MSQHNPLGTDGFEFFDQLEYGPLAQVVVGSKLRQSDLDLGYS